MLAATTSDWHAAPHLDTELGVSRASVAPSSPIGPRIARPRPTWLPWRLRARAVEDGRRELNHAFETLVMSAERIRRSRRRAPGGHDESATRASQSAPVVASSAKGPSMVSVESSRLPSGALRRLTRRSRQDAQSLSDHALDGGGDSRLGEVACSGRGRIPPRPSARRGHEREVAPPTLRSIGFTSSSVDALRASSSASARALAIRRRMARARVGASMLRYRRGWAVRRISTMRSFALPSPYGLWARLIER
jgi:hypothetical protein